jgi:hypothetical protein
MLFRPEEVHLPSMPQDVSCKAGARRVPVSNSGERVSQEDPSIPHLNGNALVTVGAGTIDPDRFTRKQPADRQRFRSSMSEPFPLTVHCDPVLAGYN